MQTATPFGTAADAESPLDGDGTCACGAHADLDGSTCEDCFVVRWSFDPMVELLDAIDALNQTPLAA